MAGRTRYAKSGDLNIAYQVAALVLLLAQSAVAGTAEVVDVETRCRGELCRFTVTVRHADTGFEHYADRFEVLDTDGNLLATRVLHHPHVDEQPFTRILPDARIPAGITRVRVRAHDLLHGHGGAERVVLLERDETGP